MKHRCYLSSHDTGGICFCPWICQSLHYLLTYLLNYSLICVKTCWRTVYVLHRNCVSEQTLAGVGHISRACTPDLAPVRRQRSCSELRCNSTLNRGLLWCNNTLNQGQQTNSSTDEELSRQRDQSKCVVATLETSLLYVHDAALSTRNLPPRRSSR